MCLHYCVLNWLNLCTVLCLEQNNPVYKFYILNWLNLFTVVSWTLYLTFTIPQALKRKIVRSWHWTMSIMMDKSKQQKGLFCKFWIKCMFIGEVLSVHFVSDKTEWILMISRNCCLIRISLVDLLYFWDIWCFKCNAFTVSYITN